MYGDEEKICGRMFPLFPIKLYDFSSFMAESTFSENVNQLSYNISGVRNSLVYFFSVAACLGEYFLRSNPRSFP